MKKRRWFSKWFLLAIVVVGIISVLTAGFTQAYFDDPETSNASSATAWTSALWTQTSQADFGAGVLSNVNTTLSANDVILSAGGSAGGANMILFWDGGGAPTDWTCISDDSGEAFYQKFIRGEAAYGGTGGAVTHTHTASATSPTAGPSATTNTRSGATAFSNQTHTQTVSGFSATVAAASNLPSYRSLKVIRYDGGGIPSIIPLGAIAIFDTTLPSGWTRYSLEDNYLVRGDASVAAGGSDTHTHNLTGITYTIGANTATITSATNSTTTAVATGNHAHSVGATTATTASASNVPPYVTVVLAKADSATTVPLGMIAMFDASPTDNWSVLSNSGGAFYQKFIQGNTTFGSNGGGDNHTHTNLTITTGAPSATANARTNGADGTYVGSSAHTHNITVPFSTTANVLPPYVNVIFAKALYASSGTIASQVLNTSVTGARWDGLGWDSTLPAGTGITFEVRASDTVFLKTDGSPSWTAVGGASPVIVSLPSGRYKQWRATLTPDVPRTSTPTLHEVRVYYYGN